MPHLFGARKTAEPDSGVKPLTRFKRMHVRQTPELATDGGVDPYDALSRAAPTHVRQRPHEDEIDPPKSEPKRDMAADLHASDPIGVNILHLALPLRTAEIRSKTTT